MSRVSRFLSLAALAGVFLGFTQSAHAAVFAQYLPGSYLQGTVPGSLQYYNDPTVLGKTPTGLTNLDFGYSGVVSPFDPVSDADQMVLIGVGGHVTLQFPQPLNPAKTLIGVFSNAGLIDNDFPNGTATNPASIFSGGQAEVSVSQDGNNFVSIGIESFFNPENYYLNAGPQDISAPANPQLTDFGQPFTLPFSTFNGETYPQILSTLNGSAGGNWLDFSSTGLSQVNYIRFTEPASIGAGAYVALSAVSVANNVPEPTSLALFIVVGTLLARRRNRAS